MNCLKYLLILSFLLSFWQTPAQNKSSNQDSLVIQKLISEMNGFNLADSQQFHEHERKIEKLLQKNNFKYLQGDFILAKSRLSFLKKDFESVERTLHQAEKVFGEIHTQKEKSVGLAKTQLLAAIAKSLKTGNVEEEQQTYLKLIPIFEKYGEKKSLNTAYGNLGLIFYNQNQFEKAYIYFLKSYETGVDAESGSKNRGNSALNLVMTTQNLGRLDEMEKYLNIAEKELSHSEEVLPQSALYHHLKGQFYLEKGNYDQTISENLKSLEIANKFNEPVFLMNANSGIAHAYFLKNDFRNSLKFLYEYYQDTKKHKQPASTLSSLINLADLENKLGNPSQAYVYMTEYVALRDSLDQKTIIEKLHTLETEFQTVQKQNQINQLQYDNERKDWKLKQNRIWVGISIAAVVILMVLAFLLYKNIGNQKKINVQEKNLHQLELAKLDQEHHIQMLSSLIQGAENERQRLGRDLHDGLGGLLSGIKLKLNSFFSSNLVSSTNLESELKSDLDNAINEMRNVSQSLLPDMLENYGLSEALKQYCARLSGEELLIDFQSFNISENSDKEKQLIFYRIAQELINNAVKHANAHEIFVQLQERDNQLFLTVEDDGIGFDEKETETKGSGIFNLKHRIQYLKGTLEFSSKKGEGTSVYITCPI